MCRGRCPFRGRGSSDRAIALCRKCLGSSMNWRALLTAILPASPASGRPDCKKRDLLTHTDCVSPWARVAETLGPSFRHDQSAEDLLNQRENRQVLTAQLSIFVDPTADRRGKQAHQRSRSKMPPPCRIKLFAARRRMTPARGRALVERSVLSRRLLDGGFAWGSRPKAARHKVDRPLRSFTSRWRIQ